MPMNKCRSTEGYSLAIIYCVTVN